MQQFCNLLCNQQPTKSLQYCLVLSAYQKLNCLFDWVLLRALQTPLALLDRVKRNGAKEIRSVMSDWKFWIPTKNGQVLLLHMHNNNA